MKRRHAQRRLRLAHLDDGRRRRRPARGVLVGDRDARVRELGRGRGRERGQLHAPELAVRGAREVREDVRRARALWGAALLEVEVFERGGEGGREGIPAVFADVGGGRVGREDFAGGGVAVQLEGALEAAGGQVSDRINAKRRRTYPFALSLPDLDFGEMCKSLATFQNAST